MKCPVCDKYKPLWDEDSPIRICKDCPHRYEFRAGEGESWKFDAGIYSVTVADGRTKIEWCDLCEIDHGCCCDCDGCDGSEWHSFIINAELKPTTEERIRKLMVFS